MNTKFEIGETVLTYNNRYCTILEIEMDLYTVTMLDNGMVKYYYEHELHSCISNKEN